MPATVALALLGLLVAAALPPVRSAAVAGEMRTSSLRFTLAENGALAEGNALDWFAAEGMARLDGSARAAGPVSFLDTVAGQGSLQLSRLRLSAGARVELEVGSAPRLVELTVACGGDCPAVRVDASGRHFRRVNASGRQVQGSNRYFLEGGAGTASLVLRPGPGKPLLLGENLRVDALSFVHRGEVVLDGPETELHRTSGVLGGRLTFPEMDGRTHELAPGSWLAVALRHAEIQRLSAQGDTLVVGFSGRATRVTLGRDSGARNLLPRRVEWLYAQHPVMLVIGGIVALVTVVGTLWPLVRKE